LPTLPIVAPKLGVAEVTMDNGQTLPVRAAMLRLTQLFNVTGHPAISLPIPTSGLPAGLQLVGRRDGTEDLLAVAAEVSRVASCRFAAGRCRAPIGCSWLAPDRDPRLLPSMPTTERLRAALADRYAVEREIGSGGMATVYLARDLKHEREVALKVLRADLSAVIGAERFLSE